MQTEGRGWHGVSIKEQSNQKRAKLISHPNFLYHTIHAPLQLLHTVLLGQELPAKHVPLQIWHIVPTGQENVGRFRYAVIRA